MEPSVVLRGRSRSTVVREPFRRETSYEEGGLPGGRSYVEDPLSLSGQTLPYTKESTQPCKGDFLFSFSPRLQYDRWRDYPECMDSHFHRYLNLSRN